MVTSAIRIQHYNNRMVSSLIDPVLTAINAAAVANFTAYAIDFVPKQSQAFAVLDTDNVKGPIRFMYSAYFGELYAASKRLSGPALNTVGQVLKDKWLALGCLGPTLITIAAVLGITVT